MKKSYCVAGEGALNVQTVAFETTRVNSKWPTGLALSGIAAIVSMGVPFSRIAQAAPVTSYMAANNLESIELTQIHGSAFAGAQSIVQSNLMGTFASGNGSTSSGDFPRIASTPVASIEAGANFAVSPREQGGKRRAPASPAMALMTGAASVFEPASKSGVVRAERGEPRWHDAARLKDAKEPRDIHDALADELRDDMDASLLDEQASANGNARVATGVNDGAPGEAGDLTAHYRKPWVASRNPSNVPVSMSVRAAAPIAATEIFNGVTSATTSQAPIADAGETHPESDEAANAISVEAPTVAMGRGSEPDPVRPQASVSEINDEIKHNPHNPQLSFQLAADEEPQSGLADIPEKADVKIGQIEFTGNNLFDSKALLHKLQLYPTTWGSWYTNSNVYSREKLSKGLEQIRRDYLNRGYLEYRIESLQTSIDPDTKRLGLAIVIHEGQPYTLSSFRLEGTPRELDTQADNADAPRVGEFLSMSRLFTKTNAIVDDLRSQGYAYATVNPVAKVDPDRHTVDLTLQIDAGRRIAVRHITVSGNTLTRDEVVRRAMGKNDHNVYNPRQLAKSRERLESLGYFSVVDVSTVPVPDAPDQVDVDVRVAEKPDASVTLGAGYSISDGPVGSASLRQNNLFGTGQSIAGTFSAARSFRKIGVTQTNPFFTENGISRTTNAYFRASEPLYYSSDSRFRITTAGASLIFGLPIAQDSKLDLGAAIERNRLDVDNLTPQAYRDYIQQNGRASNSVLLLADGALDRRDSTARASRGYQGRVGVEYGTPAGGAQYYKADASAKFYYPIARDVVLSASLQGGYGKGVGKRLFPIFKNYFAGGIGSVRGYDPNSLSPRDVKTAQPIGGSKMLSGSLELSLPLPATVRDKGLSALAFVDGGNVWGAQGESVGANGLRFSYGVGLAWNLPVGSIKTSVGLPIVRHQYDRYQKFQIQFEGRF